MKSLGAIVLWSFVASITMAAPIAPPDALTRFRELEAEGATIGTIRVDPQNIFDLADERENGMFFQLANALHVHTREEVVRGLLLFKPGERVSARLIDETERLLRNHRSFYDVEIRPANYANGVVDVEVITRDSWTLELTGRLSRSGGENTTAFGVKEDNLLGTGTRVGFSGVSDPDRHGWLFEVSYPRAFDGWTRLSYAHGHFNDGQSRVASILRPFYALDTRWAAGLAASDVDRIDSIYNAGEIVAGYRHKLKQGEGFGGWSPGFIGGWTQRYSLGVTVQDDAYEAAVNETPLLPFPVNHKVRGPFARWEVVEDRFVRVRNRDQIARPEFAAMGLELMAQATRSLESWGASRSAWLYSARVARGFPFPWGHDLQATLTAERRIDSTGQPLLQAGGLLRYYAPWTHASALYASLSFDRLGTAAAPDQLMLGGDNGLRGYPLRYQAGEKRALATIEQRIYTDWYPFRLVRVGGAVFFDHGRAWGGVNQNVINPGWLSDAGLGLRLAFDRAGFANVLHVDVAFPFDRVPGEKSVQLLVKTYLTF